MKDPWLSIRLTWRLFVGLLRHQLIHWPTTIREEMRWPLAFICSLVPALVAALLAQAPPGTFNAVLDNLFTPRGAYCAFAVLLLLATGFVYTVLTAKIVKTL